MCTSGTSTLETAVSMLQTGEDPLRREPGDPLHERAYGGSGAALRRVAVRLTGVEGGAGDVQVRPADAVRHEVLQEHSGDQHAAVAVADVGDVGYIRVERLAQLGRQRHRPGLLARALGGGDQLLAQAV